MNFLLTFYFLKIGNFIIFGDDDYKITIKQWNWNDVVQVFGRIAKVDGTNIHRNNNFQSFTQPIQTLEIPSFQLFDQQIQTLKPTLSV